MRSDQARLEDILWAIANIKAEFELNRFHHDSIYRFGIVKYLEIIGEAARHVSDNLKNEATKIEWSKIIAFRNLVVHQYFEIDWDTVLDIVIQDIPKLEKLIKELK